MESLAHLSHLAEVKTGPGARQNVWVMAPLQARLTHVAGLRVASREGWAQDTPGGGRGATG